MPLEGRNKFTLVKRIPPLTVCSTVTNTGPPVKVGCSLSDDNRHAPVVPWTQIRMLSSDARNTTAFAPHVTKTSFRGWADAL